MPCASGRRKQSRSSSAIVEDKERGRHDLTIDAGTLDAAAAAAGERGLLLSSPFTVGGHRWRVQYYPNGKDAESKGWVSIFLLLDESSPSR
jgi:speckle-type POZ protein